MMKKIAVFLGVVFSLSLVGFGQNRTVTARRNVTNSDLETFRQKRLDAERDYRENYERMGFPSPEELAKQRDDDMADRLQLADQLRQAGWKRSVSSSKGIRWPLMQPDSTLKGRPNTIRPITLTEVSGADTEVSADSAVLDPAGRLAGFSRGTMLSGHSRVTGFYPPADFKPSALLRRASFRRGRCKALDSGSRFSGRAAAALSDFQDDIGKANF